MRPRFLVAASLILAPASSPAAEPSGGVLAKLAGFRDVRCGSAPTSAMRPSGGPTDIAVGYVRDTDDLKIGAGGTLASIEYAYIKGRFIGVTATTTDREATLAVVAALGETLGPPTVNPGYPANTWTGPRVEVSLALLPDGSGRGFLTWMCRDAP